ncbi:MAG: hypothetical protein WAQ27_04080 [Candidatus Microsaccharimonas sp.]
MADLATTQPEEVLTFWARHRLPLLLVIVVLVALGLTVVSMFAYNFSGAAQVDLSRPGYSSVSGQVDRTDKITEYSAFGSVNKDTINEFTKLYDEQAAKAKAVDAFNGDPLNPEVLEFGTTVTE